jgi:hypothetical protein
MIPRTKWPARDELAGLRASFNTDDDVTKAIWADEDQKQRKIMSWPL